MRKIDKVIVHCTATPEGRYTTVEDVRRWHKVQGWSDIGYHYIVYLDGTVHEGRPVELVGAHCKGHNTGSIGIAYVGGIDAIHLQAKDTRTIEQKIALVDMLSYFKTAYPTVRIYGHRDFATKACPSFDAKTEYKDISNMW